MNRAQVRVQFDFFANEQSLRLEGAKSHSGSLSTASQSPRRHQRRNEAKAGPSDCIRVIRFIKLSSLGIPGLNIGELKYVEQVETKRRSWLA